ncbi:MAG: hypothetical protein Tp1111DCM1126091_19 [Prokaryotic dsDNA virus sp.]|nr:MAG: hypothetical protein Tp1111DCM1126091_19 [Prokaryotic dsDNA virus sp.]|tara:strand:- start:5462 stop:5821 length:360 start_codon:yes stop_codon:yes gene_type:complete
MIINVSAYGISSQYKVDFSRADKVALETFLATKGVYLSDRQVNAFVDSGEGVQFDGHGRKWIAATTVRDITNEVMTDKARQIIRKFLRSITANATSKTLVSRAMKVKKVAQAYNLEHML